MRSPHRLLSLSSMFVAVLLCTHCAHRTRTVVTSPAVSPPGGSVGFTFLPAPGAERSEAEGHQFVPPSPRTELAPPDFPRSALAAGASPFHVVVRITIDPIDGRVVKVEPSPLQESSTGPFEKEFRIAVERAVRRWRFTPGRIDVVERGADRERGDLGDVARVIESLAIPVLYDVRFDFEIVGREGKVRSYP